jgi:hypothetical protein
VASSANSRPSPSRPAQRKRYGRETPRVFTPPLRELTPDTSLGFSVIEFCDEVLEVELLPWQRWLLVHMLELLPDNSLRFRTVIVLVARQNGKSTLSQILALWFMYVYGVGLILGTAQDLDTAEEVWQGAVDLVQEVDEYDNPVRPEMTALLDRVVMVNGKKAMVLKGGQRYKVKAANRRSARGLSGDIVLLDELREHQSWDAWGAITKTTMARAMALILALSNAGDATSVVLRYLRKMTHAALGDPDGINADDDPADLLPFEDDVEDVEIDEDDDSVAIFEWSAPPGCDVHDRDGWAQANPSMGHTITERTIASACKTDPEWIFRTEVLCQWSDGSLEGPFPPGAWDGCLDSESGIGDAPITACVDVSWGRATAHIGVAGARDDELPHVELVASRAGTDWVVGWFTDDAHPDRATWPIVVQGGNTPAASLIPDLEAAGLTVIEWKGPDLGVGTANVYDLAKEGMLRHRKQPLLDVAAATAVPKMLDSGAFVWDRRKSPTDCSPLIAVTGALWGMAHTVPVKSAYEDHDLLVV